VHGCVCTDPSFLEGLGRRIFLAEDDDYNERVKGGLSQCCRPELFPSIYPAYAVGGHSVPASDADLKRASATRSSNYGRDQRRLICDTGCWAQWTASPSYASSSPYGDGVSLGGGSYWLG